MMSEMLMILAMSLVGLAVFIACDSITVLRRMKNKKRKESKVVSLSVS